MERPTRVYRPHHAECEKSIPFTRHYHVAGRSSCYNERNANAKTTRLGFMLLATFTAGWTCSIG